MKNKMFLIAGLLIVIAFIVLSLGRKKTTAPLKTEAPAASNIHAQDQTPASGQSSSPTNSTPPSASSPQLSVEKRENLKEMTRTLARYARPQVKLNELLDHLKDTGQRPQVAADRQDLIEDMYSVRTNNPLTGTRYFHAEYLEEEKGKVPEFQRMTFEFQPSAESMTLAIAAVKESFPDLGKVLYQTEDFIQWELPEGYAASVTKLSAIHLQGHPYNAYTRADIGTVRVTVEKRPGGH